jgi:hypothetical protein
MNGLHDWATGAHLTPDNGYLFYGPSFYNDYRAEYLIKTDSNGGGTCNTFNTQTITGSPELATSSSWGRLSHGTNVFEIDIDVQSIPLIFDSLLCQPVLVVEQDEPAINIYPNPASNYFNVDIPESLDIDQKLVKIIISNILGVTISEIRTFGLAAGKMKIDVSDFQSGIYIISVFDNIKWIQTKEIVIIR